MKLAMVKVILGGLSAVLSPKKRPRLLSLHQKVRRNGKYYDTSSMQQAHKTTTKSSPPSSVGESELVARTSRRIKKPNSETNNGTMNQVPQPHPHFCIPTIQLNQRHSSKNVFLVKIIPYAGLCAGHCLEWHKNASRSDNQ